MGLNSTPSASRLHIGIFGRRNAGKSSLINAITGQETAIVSDVPGTTTDPVPKAMELPPVGPVLLIDTPGLDDDGGELGAKRVEKALRVLNRADMALVVVDGAEGIQAEDSAIIARCREKHIPTIVVINKLDLVRARCPERYESRDPADGAIWVSAGTGENIAALKEAIAAAPDSEPDPPLVRDLLAPGDAVVLVVPIDESAPKGRLILPQQQTIRDILDADASAVVCKEGGLRETLAHLGKRPRLVITDSQVFARVSADTPPDIPLTSFSILFARRNGVLEAAAAGVKAVDTLRDGDKVLICEGCTHHRQCGDIGTVKLPRWIEKHTGCRPQYEFTSGEGFPETLAPYRMIIHCGGCMLNGREVRHRLQRAQGQGVPMVPMTNYGILIAHLQGILRRSVQPFPAVAAILDGGSL